MFLNVLGTRGIWRLNFVAADVGTEYEPSDIATSGIDQSYCEVRERGSAAGDGALGAGLSGAAGY
jgi:hypothetical protein